MWIFTPNVPTNVRLVLGEALLYMMIVYVEKQKYLYIKYDIFEYLSSTSSFCSVVVALANFLLSFTNNEISHEWRLTKLVTTQMSEPWMTINETSDDANDIKGDYPKYYHANIHCRWWTKDPHTQHWLRLYTLVKHTTLPCMKTIPKGKGKGPLLIIIIVW